MLIVLLAASGMRVGEALGLDINNVSEDGKDDRHLREGVSRRSAAAARGTRIPFGPLAIHQFGS